MAIPLSDGWVEITSETSCDQCGRDNRVEVTVYSRHDCPELLCADCAAEWEESLCERCHQAPGVAIPYSINPEDGTSILCQGCVDADVNLWATADDERAAALLQGEPNR